MFEAEFFAKSGPWWERRFFGCSADQFPLPKYETLHKSFDMVVRVQAERGWDPSNPSTEISKRLFDRVGTMLKPSDASDLRLYCALGTALDMYHGADGFLRVRTHVVLLDLTVRRDKVQRKSVIFRKSDKSNRRIGAVAEQIASLLNGSIYNNKLV